MNTSAGPRVFELRCDMKGRKEEAYDAVLDQSPEYTSLRFLVIHEGYEPLPNEVWFWGSLDRIRNLDMLLVDVGWTVISKKMLDALEALGPFPHAVIPVQIKDASDTGETLEDQYVVLLVTAETHALDRERSEITYMPNGRIRTVKKWVFKDMDLPPLFKIPENAGPILLSALAGNALVDGAFKGIHVLPQEKIGRL
ncbi:MAG TPA: DUF1629 domain-containing protein [Polyangiaceae bacterium]|nr:DUF1629 domain-containing protein [Polyangiaceae bacterium]